MDKCCFAYAKSTRNESSVHQYSHKMHSFSYKTMVFAKTTISENPTSHIFSQPCAADLVHPNLVHPNLVRGNRPAHKVAQGTGGLADGHIYNDRLQSM